MPEWIWPGDSLAIAGDDRGLAYGQGVFETLRVTPAGPALLEAHLDRLIAGCRVLGIPFGSREAEAWWRQASADGLLAPETPAVLKVTVTGGSGGRGYRPPEVVSPRVITSVAPVPEVPREGARIRLCRQTLAAGAPAQGYKTLARLDQVLASAELAADEFEGLMAVDEQSGWIEGTRSCLFSVMGQTLVTPPRDQLAVAGVLRDWLVANLDRMGLTVEERGLTWSDLWKHGLLLGNSVMGLVPVRECDGRVLALTNEARQLVESVNREFGFE
ncbi:aminotransferase class IV [Salicola sp. Rm-C-2C1-2]|uniref:aminotransferase class IV n=1 Tax=Salicola sp. Rm-C-2C1-2 TaxID=3141321 RepID=UPI0032E383D0